MFCRRTGIMGRGVQKLQIAGSPREKRHWVMNRQSTALR